jgi:signal transduction histidine kinase
MWLGSANRPGEYRDLNKEIAFTWEIMGKNDSALHYYKQSSQWDAKAQKLNAKNQQDAILAQLGHYDRGIELQKNRRSNTILIISLIALGLLLATIIQALRAVQRKKRHEDLLYKQKIDEMVLHQETENALAVAAGASKAREATAQHLHDGVGSVLIALQWELEAISKEHKGDERANRALETVKIAYQEVKKSVMTLRRNRMDWLINLQKFCEVVSKSQKIEAKVLYYGLDETIAPEIGEEARLIAQELVANALKHAGATRLTIQINRVGSELNISVEDNGKGFDPDEVSKGDGLRNLAARIARLNGVFDIDSNKGAGTTIFVTIPITQ